MINFNKISKMIVLLSFLCFNKNIFALKILENVKVIDAKVTMKNIVWTNDEKLLNQFEEIELGTINLPGGKMIIRKKDIEGRLSKEIMSNVFIPEKVLVERVYKSVKKEELIEEAKKQLKIIYQDTDYDYLVTISGGDTLKMPMGNLRYIVNNNFKRELGNKSLELLVYNGEEKVYKIPINVKVGKIIREYTLKKDVKKGDIYREGLVEVEEEFVYTETKLKGSRLVEGYVFTRDILSGNKLTETDLIKNTFVKVGDKVTIYIQFNNMYITDNGKILEAGDIGEEVKVENLRTGKIIKGRIREDKSVKASIE